MGSDPATYPGNSRSHQNIRQGGGTFDSRGLGGRNTPGSGLVPTSGGASVGSSQRKKQKSGGASSAHQVGRSGLSFLLL